MHGFGGSEIEYARVIAFNIMSIRILRLGIKVGDAPDIRLNNGLIRPQANARIALPADLRQEPPCGNNFVT